MNNKKIDYEKSKYMKMAVMQAKQGIAKKHGGPFGTVIVKNGEVVAKGHNHVLKNNDPTCHGEIDAIRKACKKLKTFDLTGCELYTTGEPCPMCLCACLWANIEVVYYGCTIKDNERIGFRDDKFDKLLGERKNLKNYLVNIDREECLKLFEEYSKSQHDLY